jgi:hypothetical protein
MGVFLILLPRRMVSKLHSQFFADACVRHLAIKRVAKTVKREGVHCAPFLFLSHTTCPAIFARPMMRANVLESPPRPEVSLPAGGRLYRRRTEWLLASRPPRRKADTPALLQNRGVHKQFYMVSCENVLFCLLKW